MKTNYSLTRIWSLGRALILVALLGLFTTTAAADTIFADFEGPNTSGETSHFLDDFLSGTGTFKLEGAGDIIVDKLRADPTVAAPGAGDEMYGATVTAIATFTNGIYTGAAGDIFQIASADGTKVYLEGSIRTGSFLKGSEIFPGVWTWFGNLVIDPIPSNQLNVTSGGVALPAAQKSEWIEVARSLLEAHGAQTVLLFGLNDPPPGSKTGDKTVFANVTGKLIPNPEPVSLALVSAGIGLGVLVRRRRKQTA